MLPLISVLTYMRNAIFLYLLEIGRSDSFFMVLEEQLVGFLNPFANILHGLRTDLLPERFTLP